jgi:uncharacterized cupredoxin-like copper-binding protein
MFLRLSVAIVVACGAPPAVHTAATARPTTGTVTFTTVESSTEPPGATLVELSSYAFKPADIPLAAGKVVFYLVNTSKEAHAMTLRNPAVSILAVVALSADIQAGHSAVFTIENLPAAVYRVSCPIAGHGDMTATMTVR